jgi:hypothetical protein
MEKGPGGRKAPRGRNLVNGWRDLNLDRPRSVWEMITAAFGLYWRLPILFLAFAAIVVVPYELIVLAIAGSGPFTQGNLGFFGSKAFLLANSFIVTPLISALHVQAVREVGEGGTPKFTATFRKSLPRLPVVAVAAGISGVATSLAGLAFVIPGLFLAAIWPVVAQAAALEGGGPIDALRRSFVLTRGNRWHALGLVISAGLVTGVVTVPLFFAFRHTTTTAGTFVGGTALEIALRSFEALVTALLYFDLVARSHGAHVVPPMGDATTRAAATGNPLDPNSWSDEDRPPGWYVDPNSPWMMRYWAADGTPTWSKRSTKTPKKVQAEWEANRRKSEDRG